MLKLYRSLGVCLVVSVAPFLMHAQVERASILGNPTDNSSAAVPNVVVTVTNEATNTSVRVVTDSAGAFAVMNLIPGTYTVSAALAGFNAVTYRGVELQVGQQARLDLQMQVGELKQTVEVAALGHDASNRKCLRGAGDQQ